MNLSDKSIFESPKPLKQFMFDNHISSGQIIIFLILNILSVYYKEIVQNFVPILLALILCYLLCASFTQKALVGNKPNINNFNFYLSNDNGKFSLVEKVKNIAESNRECEPDILSKLNEIFDSQSYLYKYDITPYSSSRKSKDDTHTFTQTPCSVAFSSSLTPNTCSMSTAMSSMYSSSSISSCVPTSKPILTMTTSSLMPKMSVSDSSKSEFLAPNQCALSTEQINSIHSPNSKDDHSTNSVNYNILQKASITQTVAQTNLNQPLPKPYSPENIVINPEASVNVEISRDEFKSSIKQEKLLKVNDLFSSLKDTVSLLPKFTGNFQEYRNFRSSFSTIVNHLDFTDENKAILLYMSLSQEVIQILGPITVDDKINYRVLWNLLDNEYCRPQCGLLYHGAALTSLSDWNVCDSMEKLNNLYNFLLLHHRALEREGELGRNLAVGMIVASKLEGELLEKVCAVLGNPPENSVLEHILSLIKDQINFMEICKLTSPYSNKMFQGKVSEEENLISSSKLDNFIPKSCLKSNTHVSKKCLFCHQDTHISHACEVYNRPSDFHNILFRNFSCYNCLEVGHKSYGCPKPKICSLCQDPRKHSPVICSSRYALIP